MHSKIERYRAERPKYWATIEEPLNLGADSGWQAEEEHALPEGH